MENIKTIMYTLYYNIYIDYRYKLYNVYLELF